MHLAIAQASEIVDAAKGWGDQLPALGLGVVAMGGLVLLFLRHLNQREEEAATERQERDAIFTGTLREVSERADERARECHAVQREATERERETAEVLGSVRGALESNSNVTMDVGKVVEEARRELDRSRMDQSRASA